MSVGLADFGSEIRGPGRYECPLARLNPLSFRHWPGEAKDEVELAKEAAESRLARGQRLSSGLKTWVFDGYTQLK